MKLGTVASCVISVVLLCFALSSASSNHAPAASQEVTRQEFDRLRDDLSQLKGSFEGLRDAGTRTSEAVAFLSLSSPPVGTIVPFAGEWPPKKNDTQRWTEQELGWMLCNGRSFPKTQFKDLSAVIGNAWGGDTTNFNLPDLRGLFLRGVDNGAGSDPDVTDRSAINPGGNTGNTKDAVGSFQKSAYQEHDHGGGVHSHKIKIWNGAKGEFGGLIVGTPDATTAFKSPIDDSAAIIKPNGGSKSETRPINAAVYWIIKSK